MRAAPHAVKSAIAWCNSMVHLNCGRCPGVLEIIRNLAICKRAKRNSTATPDKDAAAGAPGKLTASLAVSKNSADAPRSPKLEKKGAFSLVSLQFRSSLCLSSRGCPRSLSRATGVQLRAAIFRFNPLTREPTRQPSPWVKTVPHLNIQNLQLSARWSRTAKIPGFKRHD